MIQLVTVGSLVALSVKHATRRFAGLHKLAAQMPYASDAVMTLIGLFSGLQGSNAFSSRYGNQSRYSQRMAGVRIVIRSRTRNLYLDIFEHWSAEESAALAFRTVQEAGVYCHEQRLVDCDVVVLRPPHPPLVIPPPTRPAV